MAKRKKRASARRSYLENKTSLVIGLWVVALIVAFIFLGSVVRSILWIFLVGAIASYFVLNKKK
ncbi:MAG TPA: hypothetical protein VJC10_03825 [Patescibacteria group bacterium]|nr:hypothetical protein [Patescibacteria group bacterium]